jgi:hypothetical protein
LVGQLLAQTDRSDVVDAHVGITAVRLGHDIITGGPHDLATLTMVLGPAARHVRPSSDS